MGLKLCEIFLYFTCSDYCDYVSHVRSYLVQRRTRKSFTLFDNKIIYIYYLLYRNIVAMHTYLPKIFQSIKDVSECIIESTDCICLKSINLTLHCIIIYFLYKLLNQWYNSILLLFKLCEWFTKYSIRLCSIFIIEKRQVAGDHLHLQQ